MYLKVNIVILWHFSNEFEIFEMVFLLLYRIQVRIWQVSYDYTIAMCILDNIHQQGGVGGTRRKKLEAVTWKNCIQYESTFYFLVFMD